MKALSVHPYWAMEIVNGYKTIECRTWKTDYRGDLVICSTAKKYHGTIPGHALGVVTLADIVPFEKKHLKAAGMLPSEFRPGCFAWILTDNRIITPQPAKGKLSLWEYTGPVEYVPREKWAVDAGDPDDDSWYQENGTPLLT